MPSRKNRKRSPVNLKGILLLIAAVAVVCCYAFYYLSPPAEKNTGKEPTEQSTWRRAVLPRKPVPTKIDFTSSCRQTTYRIERFLTREGVLRGGFRLVEQYSIDQEGKKWLFTKATIDFPRAVDPALIATELITFLEDDGLLSFTWHGRGYDSGDLLISTDQVLTHVLTIVSRLSYLAIIIDDVGNDLQIAQELLDLGVPLTLSILPNLPYSKPAETLAHERGYEVMLHVPMEPREASLHHLLGKDAIFHDMEKNEVVRMMSGWLKNFPHVKGVNNHMGSLVTEDERVMSWVMETIAPRDLYFIDSRTSSQSVAYQVADEMGIRAAMNYIFIDNEPEVDSCKDFIEKAIRHVKEQGTGIAIGHARRTTLQALREVMYRIQDDGIRLVFVSELLERSSR